MDLAPVVDVAQRSEVLLQDLVEPRLMAASTPEVRVRAITDGSQIAFRLEWPDAELDDVPGAGRFPDGCAVQLPQQADVNAPDQRYVMLVEPGIRRLPGARSSPQLWRPSDGRTPMIRRHR